MCLLHHWILSTSQSLSEPRILDAYWQTVFPQIAFLHPFVMHGILSIAALHLAYLQGVNKQRRMIDAARHHNVVLQGFRDHITQPSDDNSDALFACASLNLLYVFGLPFQRHDRQDGEAEPASRISRILGAEWIPMSRGVEAILLSVYERVRLGPLRAMLDLGNWEELSPDNEPSDIDLHLSSVRELWAVNGDDEVYDKTLYVLRKCCAYVQQLIPVELDTLPSGGQRKVWSGYLLWLHFAPEEYFLRLRQRQPTALLLFAFYGAVLHSANGYWFLEEWGRSMVEVVDELLGDYWSRWMKWPKEVVGLAVQHDSLTLAPYPGRTCTSR